MRNTVLILFFPLFFISSEISPQIHTNKPVKVITTKKVIKDSEQEFKRKMDSIHNENSKLAKEVNKLVDDYNKNIGYIKNNEKRIKKQEKKAIVKVDPVQPIEMLITDVYIPVEECLKHRTFVGRILHNTDCKEWGVTDSIHIEIVNY